MPKPKPEPTTALATVTPGVTAMAVSDTAVAGDRRGGKDILNPDDVALARIALGQGTSPQRKRTESCYMADLEEGDLFNTVTEEIYGPGPLTIAIITIQKRAAVHDNAGRVVERDVDWNDPRCEWTGETDAAGKRVKPTADRIYDYIVALVDEGQPTGEIAALSLKKTGIKVAKKLNGVLSVRPGASWEGLYTVTAVPDKADNFNFFNYKFRPAGPASPAVKTFCEQAFLAYQAAGGAKIEETAPVADGVVEGQVTDANEDAPY